MAHRARSLICTVAAIAAIATASAVSAATGAATPAHPVRLVVALKLRDAAGLDALIARQTNPASPLYAHFLTPKQFRETYAPTAQAYAATVTELSREGFAIERTHGDRTTIDVNADAATVERAFGVTLRVAGIGSAHRYLADRTPTMNAALPAVAAVAGLEPDAVGVVDAQSASIGQPLSNVAHGLTAVQPDDGFAPAAFARAYDLPLLHGFDGTGTVAADLVDGEPDAGLQQLLHLFHIKPLAPIPTVVPVDGGAGKSTLEADFDFEWLYGTAPGARMYDYEIPALTITAIVDAFAQIASDDKVDVVNLPFAACENITSLAYAALPIMKQAAAEGIAFETVSVGGSAYCGFPGIPMPTFPADSSDALAVGGNNVIANAAGETLATSGYESSGGGVSLIVAEPAGQRGIKGVTPGGRNVPDITIPAEINGTGPSFFGGVPAIANGAAGGMLAELTQQSGHRLGAFANTLDALFKANGYGSAFRDITVGCNGLVGTTLICAGPNYDRTSGLGTLDAYSLGLLLGASK